MGMPAATYWTAEMVRALPEDGNRYEVVYGELLVTPAPRMLHQIVVHRLTFALSAYLQSHPVGLAFGVPGDITWSSGPRLTHSRESNGSVSGGSRKEPRCRSPSS